MQIALNLYIYNICFIYILILQRLELDRVSGCSGKVCGLLFSSTYAQGYVAQAMPRSYYPTIGISYATLCATHNECVYMNLGYGGAGPASAPLLGSRGMSSSTFSALSNSLMYLIWVSPMLFFNIEISIIHQLLPQAVSNSCIVIFSNNYKGNSMQIFFEQ